MIRLTDVERAERDDVERDFMGQVTDLAEALGWTWCHWRPLRNSRGIWQTPVEGPLGKGWPDLTLLRIRDQRLVFAELKRQLEQPTADQVAVLAALNELVADPGNVTYARLELGCMPRIQTFVWRPSDLRDPIESSVIYEVLR